MSIKRSLLLSIMLPSPGLTQIGAQTKPGTVVVTAMGSVETAPDMATLTMTIRGEGKTPDAATIALATKQKAVLDGLRSLSRGIGVRTGSVAIAEANVGDCDNRNAFTGSGFTQETDSIEEMADALDAKAGRIAKAGAAPSKSGCVLIGYVAQIDATIVMRAVKDAGTAVGLAGRLGASEAKVEDFGIRDDGDASNRAVAKAMGTARAKAQAIATASGVTLGPIISVDDGIDGARQGPANYEMMALAPAIAPPPITVEVSPKPVETTARLTVTFAIGK